MRNVLVVLSCVFLLPAAAFGQTDRGTITGTVTDPAGAVVADAPVEAVNTATGGIYAAASTGTGNYTLSQLPAGPYQMTVTVAGFKTFIRQNIQVQVAQTLRIDIELEIGATSESVTVTDAAPLLKTESGELSHNVETTKLNNLPVLTLGSQTGLGNIRNPLQVVTLLPGTAFSNDNTLRVNGMPSSTYAIRIDGQDATNGIHREYSQVNQASLEAIEEVAVQTSNFAAEYGQAAGGYFNYTMKSGTNQFHGSVYDYFVDSALHAGTPFTDDGNGGHLKNEQRRNDYGFSAGGPITIPGLYDGHDRSFFFFNFEQFRESQTTNTGLLTVPTEAYRRGDFSAALLPNLTQGGVEAVDALGRVLPQNGIYDPLTEQVASDGSTVRDMFPGNIIPVSRMSPVAGVIQGFMPLPLGSRADGLINNYEVPPYTNSRTTSIPAFKVDHNLSNNVKINWYYSQTRTFSPRTNQIPADNPLTGSYEEKPVSHTTRVNYDQTVTPTMLLHLGVGFMHTNMVQLTPFFDQDSLGWDKSFATPTMFPWLGGLNNSQKGGFSYTAGTAFSFTYLKDIKPTANAYLTWVRGNHTVKTGGEMYVEGFPIDSLSRTNGNISIGATQTANPWQLNRGLNGSTGFPYASFFLGMTSALQYGVPANGRLGGHGMGFYIQDSWKVTRKLTLDYGLRYDYVTLLKEQYGRFQNTAFNLPSAFLNGRNGAVIYEKFCGCSYNQNYPHAWGPRLGMAYQINDKTVLRAGAGLTYGTSPNNANVSRSLGDRFSLGAPGYAQPVTLLEDGYPYAPGNKFGNEPLIWPDENVQFPAESQPGVRPPGSPFISIDRHSGRPPRIFQWSIGLQREITSNLVIEASYVGNRGAWFTAPLLAIENTNPLQPETLLSDYGLDIHNAQDRSLLSQPISSPAVIARFPYLANPNSVYPGFPSNQPLNQALRPWPQWYGLANFLGPPLGTTWYDSLQAKVTKRLSHGLSVDSAFTWQKELNAGVSSDTTYLTPAPNLINDIFNRKQLKQISGFSRPFMLVVSFNYTTPSFTADTGGMKALSWAVRDWTIGGVLRYQSGEVIRTPGSNNAIKSLLQRDDSPASFGSTRTFWNRVPGQDILLYDPNCGDCFDPTRDLVLNPDAFVDPAPGEWGVSAPYYNDVRWQRQPQESLSFGRIFVINAERGINVQVRAEFQNIFNRLFLANPQRIISGGFLPNGDNPSTRTVRRSDGTLAGGYGFVNTFNGGAATPRTGQIVMRLSF